jgi:trans-2,3-dihydro-3-hydroxyanthranilate isomerase
VRIFTPGREVPFAGHPTVGTAWVLATRELLPRSTRSFRLEEEIGPVRVDLEGDPTRPAFIWMHHGEPTFGAAVADRAGMAKALRLTESDLLPVPIQVVTTGNPFLFVPLRDRAAVDRALLDVPALLACVGEGGGLGVFVFAPDGAGRVYSRMFAPHTAGIPEDPATGSASGPLGAYLVRHGLVPAGDEVVILSEQGVKMKRPSQVHIRLRATGGRLADIRVGGSVAPVLEGYLTLP